MRPDRTGSLKISRDHTGNWTQKVPSVEMPAVCVSCNLTPRKFLGTHFCYRLSGPHGYWMRPERTGFLKISRYHTGIRTQKLPSRGAVRQPTVPTFTQLNKTAYNWMILYRQLERMWKELAMVQFQVLYLAEGNEDSSDCLSENSVCVCVCVCVCVSQWRLKTGHSWLQERSLSAWADLFLKSHKLWMKAKEQIWGIRKCCHLEIV